MITNHSHKKRLEIYDSKSGQPFVVTTHGIILGPTLKKGPKFQKRSKTSKIPIKTWGNKVHKCHSDTIMSSFWFWKDIYYTDRLYIFKWQVYKLFHSRMTDWNPSISRIHFFNLFPWFSWFYGIGKRERNIYSLLRNVEISQKNNSASFAKNRIWIAVFKGILP